MAKPHLTGVFRILTVLGFIALSLTVSAESQIGRYSTDRLRKLSTATGLTAITDTLADGNYRGTFRWKAYPLNVTVNNGEVSHIGVLLFTAADRDLLPPSPIYDFMERYLLEYHVFGESTTYGIDRLKADRVTVETGSFKNLHTVAGDTTLVFSYMLDNGRQYTVSWNRDGRDVFKMSFMASNKLLNGYTFDEGERKLAAKIARADTAVRTATEVNVKDLVKCDSVQGHFLVKKGEFCVLPVVNNDRYYFVRDSVAQLLYSPAYPVESLANLLVSGEIENGFTAKVRMARYGRKTDEFTVALKSLINYFLDEGCTPYFGLKGVYQDKNTITALFEMVNKTNGYEHLMSVCFDCNLLPLKKGEIEIKLTPYLPMQDVKSLYKH